MSHPPYDVQCFHIYVPPDDACCCDSTSPAAPGGSQSTTDIESAWLWSCSQGWAIRCWVLFETCPWRLQQRAVLEQGSERSPAPAFMPHLQSHSLGIHHPTSAFTWMHTSCTHHDSLLHIWKSSKLDFYHTHLHLLRPKWQEYFLA